MKTTIIKKILPLFAVLAAVFTAFATSGHPISRSLNTQGYIKNNPLGNSCTESVMCTYDGGDICTITGAPTSTQLWAKNVQSRCILEIYKIH